MLQSQEVTARKDGEREDTTLRSRELCLLLTWGLTSQSSPLLGGKRQIRQTLS